MEGAQDCLPILIEHSDGKKCKESIQLPSLLIQTLVFFHKKKKEMEKRKWCTRNVKNTFFSKVMR